jgi:hypothetical protein
MAKSFAIGQTRINPNTFMTEVWDGTKWDNGLNTITTNVGNSYTTIATNAITGSSISSRPTISATERELIFDFLKENMRVAEYLDDKGKIHTVQLEMRAGPGYVWENIRREKTKDPL